MTAQDRIAERIPESPELERIPQLYAILEIARRMARSEGEKADIPSESSLRHAYIRAPGIAKKRFDAVTADAARAATGGAQALLGEGEDRAAAAGRLADHLRHELAQLARIVGL
ncbi:hypothetical protein [Parasphingopyxis sp.]|uniref:hypothetical protein n=1 Tax=Parasphingopyxis sp. TaxID=1920299 RepID=UPI00260B02D1|nr:hypothetical protein [Parasphingopyxis sp.]